MKLWRNAFFHFKLSHLASYLTISIVPVVLCAGMLFLNSINEQKIRLDELVLHGFLLFLE